ncbi:MAG: hypothetical protein M1839_000079 [Geoglossum umbratile]|nr:MAG: hypothetical protein M1839_000079 [Geoglossum umbratile]
MAPDSNSGEGIEATSSEFPSGDEGVRTPATPAGSDGNERQQELDLTLASAQDLTSRLLDFLSNANNETLGACLVGLGAATYFVFGRIGLVLIGAVGGVVLHATWESGGGGGGESGDGTAGAREARRRREVALDVIERVLDWRDRKRDDRVSTGDEVELKAGATKPADFSGLAPETAAALEGLTDAVVRDYVKWWYAPILPSEQSFPDTCRQTFTAFILSVSSHLSRKRPADTFLEFTTNSSSIIIVFLSELSHMLSAAPNPQTSPEELVYSYLEDNPDSSLASVIDVKHQKKKLEMVAEDILQTFLEPKTYNCEPARTFLREVLAGVVLEMTIQSCSTPEFINEWIVYLLEDGEPELMNAIDAGVGRATGGSAVTADSTNAREMEKGHRRRLSKAEEAMEEAMLEAERLSQLIAEEEAKKNERQRPSVESASAELPENKRSSAPASPLGAANTATPNSSIPRDAPPDPTQAAQTQPTQVARPIAISESTFTSFDQIAPLHRPTALHAEQTNTIPKFEPSRVTLHNANVSIFDDAVAFDKSVLRGKPSADYLIQIEPSLSNQPGWMIARRYADFEALHEVLRRISTISGAGGFVLKHSELPSWRGQTKSSVRTALEKYLIDALRYQQLAESEKMKKFLEKDQAPESGSPSVGGKGGFWPNPAAFETMGKGVLDVLSSAPKGAAEGGKALFGGVSGVLGGVASLGQKKPTAGSNLGKSCSSSSISLPRTDSVLSESSGQRRGRDSQESFRNEPSAVLHSTNTPLVDSPGGTEYPVADKEPHTAPRASSPLRTSLNRKPSKDLPSQTVLEAPLSLVPTEIDELLDLPPLPPPPSDIRDDYDPLAETTPHSKENLTTSRLSISTTTSPPSPSLTPSPTPTDTHPTPAPVPVPKPALPRTPSTPLTEEDTQIAIELLFAIITSLYTLSSAWNIRRTLLTAAKTFLLRPGNPNLEAIRQLLQDSVIEANTSDKGVAGYIRKVRENCLPTEEERAGWPAEMTGVEKERLRGRARKLLVERGMPRALVGVMGQAASKEALGRVFDCLQVDEVRRGFMFGLLLQGLRAVTQ